MFKNRWLLFFGVGLSLFSQMSFAVDQDPTNLRRHETTHLYPSRDNEISEQPCHKTHCPTWKLLLSGTLVAAGAASCTLVFTQRWYGGDSDNEALNRPQAGTFHPFIGNGTQNVTFLYEEMSFDRECLGVLHQTTQEKINLLYALSFYLKRNLTEYLAVSAQNLSLWYQNCDIARVLEANAVRPDVSLLNSCKDFLGHLIHTVYAQAFQSASQNVSRAD